jgi:hypothetical protein
VNIQGPRGDDTFRLWSLRRRFLFASVFSTFLLIVCLVIDDLLIGPDSWLSPYFWPDWLLAILVVMLWLIPIAWILRLDGIRRCSLSQLVTASFVYFFLTVISVAVALLVVVLGASVHMWLSARA